MFLADSCQSSMVSSIMLSCQIAAAMVLLCPWCAQGIV